MSIQDQAVAWLDNLELPEDGWRALMDDLAVTVIEQGRELENRQPMLVDTLADAQVYVVEGAAEGGVNCPCCGQFAKEYRRALNSGMAKALVSMYQADPYLGWLHKPTVLRGVGSSARDESLLRFWGLLEESTEPRGDGGRSGWWRVTYSGKAFVKGWLLVPSHVRIYNGRSLGLEGDLISIKDVLPFDLQELNAA